MRQKLEESRKESGIRDSFRVIRGDIEKIFWMLRNMNSSAAAGTVDVGGGDTYHHEATTKAGLPSASSVNVGSFGRVNGVDADHGKGYIINPGETAWVCFTHLE